MGGQSGTVKGRELRSTRGGKASRVWNPWVGGGGARGLVIVEKVTHSARFIGSIKSHCGQRCTDCEPTELPSLSELSREGRSFCGRDGGGGARAASGMGVGAAESGLSRTQGSAFCYDLFIRVLDFLSALNF